MSTAKTNSNPKTETLLEALAKHELAVLEKIRQSERDATAIVERAHAEAAEFGAEASRRLDEEIQATRRAAQEQRESERKEILNRTRAELDRLRADVSPRVPGIVQEIVSMILPRGTTNRG